MPQQQDSTADWTPVQQQPDTSGWTPVAPSVDKPTFGSEAKSAGKAFLGEMGSNLNPVNIASGLSQAFHHPIDTLGAGVGENASKVIPDIKSGNFSGAITHAAGSIPIIGPPAARFAENVGSNNDEAAKSLADLVSLRAVPKIYGGAIGKAAEMAAPKFAENAMHIRAVDRAFGKTPGKAIINETTGFQPVTIAGSATNAIGDLSNQYNGIAARSKTPVDLTPARSIIDNATTKAKTENAGTIVSQLAPLRSHLTEAGPGFQGATVPGAIGPPKAVASPFLHPNGRPIINIAPGTAGPPAIAPLQSAVDAAALKRGFGKEHTAWNPDIHQSVNSAAKGAYHALDSELDKAVPEGAAINQRISSLIPVAQRAASTARNADMGQRMLARFAAHTGALTGGAVGLHYGGIPGGIAGLALPELVSSPTAQMVTARGLNMAGGALQHPITANAIRLALTGKRTEEEPLQK